MLVHGGYTYVGIGPGVQRFITITELRFSNNPVTDKQNNMSNSGVRG